MTHVSPRNRQVILDSMEALNPFPRHPKINELQQALEDDQAGWS